MSSDDHFSAITGVNSIDFTIAAQDTISEFSNVTIRKRGEFFHVQLTLLGEPQSRLSRAWKTGLAIDASASMKAEYGRRVIGSIPYKQYNDYHDKGWINSENRDGRKAKSLQRPAVTDALAKGFIRLSPNTLDFIAPELITYLAGRMDFDTSTHLIYWGGGNGSQIETVGDIKVNEAASLTIDGPDQMMFGDRSLLLPALKYFADIFKDASLGLIVFVTDGQIDDLNDVKKYTNQLASEIVSNQRSSLRCILIGVGEAIDEVTLKQLSSHDTDTHVNLWDYMIVSELQDFLKIFGEVVRDSQIVAACGTVYDSSGKPVKQFSRGLPTRIGFTLPVTSPWFELEMPNQKLRQAVKLPPYILRG
ncbi:MAG: vWA domain-containing protein [Syntrophomonadaceae bacterium]